MIAVILYGGFRTYHLNLQRNIKELLGEVTSPIHFYILTDYCEDYEQKKLEIVDILKSYNYEIKYFENINTCIDYNKTEEEEMNKNYHSIPFNGKKDEFTAKLFYRRCLINRIMNTFQIKYDKVISARLFDIIIKRYKSLDFINNKNDDILYYSVDTIIIGKMNEMNKMFAFVPISDIVNIPVEDLNDFLEFYRKNDTCLASILPHISSETIYQSIIFKNFRKKSINLRFDFTKENLNPYWNHTKSADNIIDIVSQYIKNDYLFVLLCPNRR